MRWLLLFLGVLLLVFGVACHNYTKAESYEYHIEQAAKKNLPPPSKTIFYIAIGSTAAGGGLIGFASCLHATRTWRRR